MAPCTRLGTLASLQTDGTGPQFVGQPLDLAGKKKPSTPKQSNINKTDSLFNGPYVYVYRYIDIYIYICIDIYIYIHVHILIALVLMLIIWFHVWSDYVCVYMYI